MALHKRYFALVTLLLTIIWLSFTRQLQALTENHELERCTNASNGDVRLAGGPNEFEGRVEICQEGAWGQVCRPVNPKVVCRQLIYPAVIPKNSTDQSMDIPQVGDGNVKGKFVVENLVCNGTESKLTECSFTIRNDSSGCSNNQYASVLCQDPVCFEEPESVRLVDGVSEGRVEVCHHSNQYRRGVCDSNWDDKDAYVTCKELKLLTNDKSPRATFGYRARYIGSAISNVSCNGSEDKTSHCSRNETNINPTCEFAGVICRDQSATTDLPLATSYSSYFSPVPSLYMTSIKTTAGPELGYTSETSPLLQTSTKTSYTASPHLSMKTVSRLSTLQSSPQPSSASVASTESTLTRGVPNKAATIGIAFGVVSGLLVLVVLIIVVLAVVLPIIVGRKQKKLSQSFKSNGHSPRCAQNDKTTTQRNGSSEYEETKRVLLNPLYTKTSLLPPHEYATLDESQFSNLSKSATYENSPYYSTCTPTPLLASHNSDTRLTTNDQGYATEDHLYDDTVPNNVTPSSLRTMKEATNANSDSNGVSNDHLYEQPPLNDNIKLDDHNTTTTDPHLYAVLENPK